nr:GTPase IMAP family member 7-like [Misgurnus anguillicaudatus]
MSEKERLLENTVKELETSKHQLETLRNELQENKSKLQLLLEENKLLKSSVSAPVRRRQSFEFNLPNMSGETASVLVSGSELRLVLLGSAGSEKSASVNIILNREEKIQTDTSTEIQQSESRQGEVNGKQVTVVETPDWFCSGLSLEEVREDVRLCVRLSAPGPHAFLLIIPVQQSTGVERAMLEKMEEIFGERCWRNTMILFTVTDEEQKKNFEDFVQSGNQEVQRLVEKCGNRFHFLNIHHSGDDSQISELLEKIEKMVEGNTERFYSSEIYLEIESQIRAMERQITRATEERKEREEREMNEK